MNVFRKGETPGEQTGVQARAGAQDEAYFNLFAGIRDGLDRIELCTATCPT